jgi:hypothetical protein
MGSIQMPRSRWSLASALALGLLATLAAGCVDPVTDDAVAALGDEAPGVRPGKLHRPGQPCLTCHGDNGPGSPKMVVGGTIFGSAGASGRSGITVKLTDANGDVQERNTNSAGNFYVFVNEWQPVWPLRVEVSYVGKDGKPVLKPMLSLLNGRVGCGTCHHGTDATLRSLPRLEVP